MNTHTDFHIYICVSVTFLINVIMNVTRYAGTKQCLTVLYRFLGYALYAGMNDVPAIADFCKGWYIIIFAGVYEDVCVVLLEYMRRYV